MSKRAIVLGGAGLIGSHLCSRLLKEEYDVVCIDRRNLEESPLLREIMNRETFHFIKHDITASPYDIGCDELYNLTAPIEFGDNLDYIDEMRLASIGSMNTLSHLIGDGTKVLYGSSDDVYYFDKLDIGYNTDKVLLSDAKRFGESIHRAYQAHHKIDLRIARIFSTYGPHAGLRDHHVVGKMIVEALNNHNITIYGDGEQLRTFCWIDDLIDGLISLMRTHNSDGGITADLGSPEKISIRALAELIISLTGSKSNIHHLPGRINEPRYKAPNLKVATNELKWEASTPLREGLQRTISYIEKELSSIAMSQTGWVEAFV